MVTTRALVGELRDRMGDLDPLKILIYLNKAYLRLCQNDIKDMIFLLCEPAGVDDVIYPYPVLKDTIIIPPNGAPGGPFSMPSCVSIIESNFQDSNGDAIEFKYHNQVIECRKVNAFFTEDRTFFQFWDSNLQSISVHDPQYNLRYLNTQKRRIKFTRVPCDLRPPDQEVPAQAFFFDRPYNLSLPTATIPQIFIEFWMTPPSLTTLDSKMLLDTDKWQDELTDGAVGYWQKVVHGFSELWEKFMRFDRAHFKNEGNSNLHNKVSQNYRIREIG